MNLNVSAWWQTKIDLYRHKVYRLAVGVIVRHSIYWEKRNGKNSEIINGTGLYKDCMHNNYHIDFQIKKLKTLDIGENS
jgi:hypothetical protein